MANLACHEIWDDLMRCLGESECVRVMTSEKLNLPDALRECLDRKHDDKVSENCRKLQYSYFSCRRGIVDMRNRFRGLPT
mmetsp:Transcript_10875/g.17811  ORF Transcript_10875/g.17811 Transcript_10875/m.17811 type:complete len:80 (+) Transcript_10875:115-354(+)